MGPAPDESIRARLGALDPAALRARLEEVDPAAAARIHANDLRRTIRALEVYELTGAPLSDQQGQWGAEPRRDVRIIGLEWPVEEINRRINARVRAMVESGLVEEVRRLLDAPRPPGVQARAALGYRQIIDHLEGRSSLEEAVEQVKIRTRRFAKQQRTWLKRFRAHPCARWFQADELDTQVIAEQALPFINP